MHDVSVDPAIPPKAGALSAPEAAAAVRVGLWISAVRCMLTYVVAPAVGILGIVLPVIGIALQVAGAITSTAGARRLWVLRHRARVPYAVLASAVSMLALVGLVEPLVRGANR